MLMSVMSIIDGSNFRLMEDKRRMFKLYLLFTEYKSIKGLLSKHIIKQVTCYETFDILHSSYFEPFCVEDKDLALNAT